MNRRVLLIDAATGFRATLTGELARYKGVVVQTEPDPDRALAAATADPPALLIITVGPDAGGKLEQLVDAETDAAFASLLGGEPAEAGPAADASAIPEPVPHVLDDDAPLEPPPDPAAPKMVLADMESVPTPEHDDGREPSDVFETASRIAESPVPRRAAAARGARPL